MPLVEMPNGEVVEVPDGISQEALERIRAQNQPNRQQRRALQARQRAAEPTEEQREVGRRVAAQNRLDASPIGRGAVSRGIDRGVTFNFGDEIAGAVNAATRGVYRAIRDRDFSQIGREYRISRDVERQLNDEAQNANPGGAIAGEIIGAVGNPIGTGARGVEALGRGAQALGAERAAAALGNTAARIDRAGAIPQAIIAGANQGALNAAGSTENLSDVPGALVNGAIVGGATGGLLGGGLHLGARATQIIRDALPRNASRTAYMRIAELLENGRMTPQQAVDEIRMSDMSGGDAMVQDLLPSLRAQAARISRSPGVPSSNDLIERGAERIANRPQLFTNKVRETVGMPENGIDALARRESIIGERRGAGQRDYAEGGALDTPLNWSDDLGRFFQDSPDADRLIRRAYDNAMRFGDDIGRIGEGGQVIPSFRAFDYLKREFDAEIGTALRSGNTTLASGMSEALNRLKAMLGEANPQYREVLATQRDLFQQQRANELGQDVLRRIGSNPRQVLNDLNALPENAKQDARIGIIDAMVNLDNRADPVAFFRNISRNENQRAVLEFAFGGRRELRRFTRFVDREVRSARADALTAPGRQSETSRIALADPTEDGGVGNVLSNAMRGYAFGGAIGVMSGITRTLGNIASGTGRAAQEEIARILLSKGENLVRGTENVRAYQLARQRNNRRRAVVGAKIGQQQYTSMAGGD